MQIKGLTKIDELFNTSGTNCNLPDLGRTAISNKNETQFQQQIVSENCSALKNNSLIMIRQRSATLHSIVATVISIFDLQVCKLRVPIER